MIMKRVFLSAVLPFLLISSAYGAKKVIIDLTTQTATAYENGQPVFSGRVSTGQPKYPTPRGTFRILQKKVKHKSSSWPKPNGGAQMDYMQRLTHYGIAMHLGFVPDYPASHGCIRLENGFAQRMYDWTYVGMPVKIVGTPPARVYRPKVAIKPTRETVRQRKSKKVNTLDLLSGREEVTAVNLASSSKKKKKTDTKKKPSVKLSALDVISASPKKKSVNIPNKKAVQSSKKTDTRIDPLAVISVSPKAKTSAKETVVKSKKLAKRKKNKSEKTVISNYKKPTTLDLLSSSPKAQKRVETAQKEKWKNIPKKRSPRVDPLKAVRA